MMTGTAMMERAQEADVELIFMPAIDSATHETMLEVEQISGIVMP